MDVEVVRGRRVMIDADLAALYGVTTKAMLQAVRRNIARFPDDFMFRFSDAELTNWRSQIVTSNPTAKMGLSGASGKLNEVFRIADRL
jgi:hypothetical protein